MLLRIYNIWAVAYTGIPSRIWFLALINLINRCGGMVITFISLYLTQKLGFSVAETGYVMGCYGVGAMAGTYLGGRLCDRLGYYWVQVWSLVLNGFILLGLLWVHDFWAMCASVLLMSVASEVFRPANSVAIAQNCEPENRTRSISLYRMSANIGWAIAPTLGGLMVGFGWHWLFWIDGLTCIAAALMLRFRMAPPARLHTSTQDITAALATSGEPSAAEVSISPWRDANFLWFVALTFLSAVVFMQLIWTIPLHFKTSYGWSEQFIGMMIALNGLLVFIIEMPLIYRIEGKADLMTFIRRGLICYILAYVSLLLPFPVLAAALLYMLMISIGEIFVMPFSSNFVLGRASVSRQGEYMAIYIMAYSIANIVSPLLGTQIVTHYGYHTLWGCMTILATISLSGTFFIARRIQSERTLQVVTD
ncbi:MAG: MFS transporter [Saprospiraceae bacterium]|nr:MFS transporter [Saprospiraceae bacterium]